MDISNLQLIPGQVTVNVRAERESIAYISIGLFAAIVLALIIFGILFKKS